jgi:hypothetical protein
MNQNLCYYRRRAKEELDAAIRACHPKARQAHSELAELYRGLAMMLAKAERRERTARP